ncbi:MAG: hypothetical protein ACM3PY_07515 [Omnitrophica WOR_2 bacterium]
MNMLQNRIDRAWEECRSWIAKFDGSPNEAYLLPVEQNILPQAFQALSRQSENFRVSTISKEARFISLDELQKNLELLQKKEVEELNANFTARLNSFSLDIHMIIYQLEPSRVALELDWWGDQVFSEAGDPFKEFQELIPYFVSLQELFNSPHLYLSPETGEKPGQQTTAWVEV